jgi:hypothetical protein
MRIAPKIARTRNACWLLESRSGEGQHEQARAQQCKACRSQREESPSREVMIAHDAPPPRKFAQIS